MNWKILTTVVFYVDEVNLTKLFIVYCWFLLAIARPMKNKVLNKLINKNITFLSNFLTQGT